MTLSTSLSRQQSRLSFKRSGGLGGIPVRDVSSQQNENKTQPHTLACGVQSAALKTDLYELTMAAGYFENRVDLKASFELSCHTMPRNRSFLIACGLQEAVEHILNLKFTESDRSEERRVGKECRS